MRKAEVQLPDQLYEKVESVAKQWSLTIPEVLREAAEQLVRNEPVRVPAAKRDWHFPEGMRLGAFLSSPEEWRSAANESAD
jgi:hypothetical protein